MKKFMTAVLSCLMLGVVCFGFTACGDTDGSELQGFDIDLAKAVCKELNVEARFQKISWDAKFNELASKNIDLIWNGMTITDEVKENCQISQPYMNNKQVAVVKKENAEKFATTEKIKAAKASIAAENGSAGADVIKSDFSGGDNKSVLSASQADALTEVNSGASDIAIIDSVMAGYYTNKGDFKDKLVIVPDLVFSEEQYGIAARKDDKGVIDKVNSALAKVYKSGAFKTIADTYGLADEIVNCGDYTATGATDGWDYIEGRGKLIIGYTVFAPIAYEK